MPGNHPFPLRRNNRCIRHSWVLPFVPWAFVAPHREQAWANHGHSLEDLALCGGLTPCELLAVLEDRALGPNDPEDCILQLCRLLRVWRAATP